MFLSVDRRFLFVRVVKTGSTSIAASLASAVGRDEESILGRTLQRRTRKGRLEHRLRSHPHWTACRARAEMGSAAYDSAFSFSFVREPVDWNYSVFRHIMSNSNLVAFQERYRAIYESGSFDAFVQFRKENGATPQALMLADRNGGLGVNAVYKFESMPSGVANLEERIGLEIDLQHVNRSRYVAKRTDEISPWARRTIQDLYEVDYEWFDYGGMDSELVDISRIVPSPSLGELVRKIGEGYDAWAD